MAEGERILEICAYNVKMETETEDGVLIRSRFSQDFDDGLGM
jgi:hypothetical protein